jgi:hypothetical protein
LIRESTLPPRHREILILRTGWLLNNDWHLVGARPRRPRGGLSTDDVRRAAEGPDARDGSPSHAAAVAADQCSEFLRQRRYGPDEYDLHHTMDAIMTVNNFTTLGLT